MDDIRTMEIKLMQYQTENERLKAELHSLKTLVKKAWCGDYSASVDVARIVGVPPPVLEISSATDKIVAVPKAPLIDNWSKSLKSENLGEFDVNDLIRREKQLRYFKDQAAYIDEQMSDAKYANEGEFNDIKKRTDLFRSIVERDKAKHASMKKRLDRNEVASSESKKTRESGGQKTHQMKSSVQQPRKLSSCSQEQTINDCLVVQTQHDHLKHQRKPKKSRPKSAVCISTRTSDEHRTATKQRVKSAKISTTPKMAAKSRDDMRTTVSGSAIRRELGKTEEDIALTVELLQKRLGIERKSMI